MKITKSNDIQLINDFFNNMDLNEQIKRETFEDICNDTTIVEKDDITVDDESAKFK